MMNINDPARPIGNKGVGENLHVTRQHHKIDMILLQQPAEHFLLTRFCFFRYRKAMKRDPELIGNGFKIGMVADDDGILAAQLAFPVTQQEIVEAVGSFGHQHRHFLCIVRIMRRPPHAKRICKITKLLFQQLARCRKRGEIQFHPHEIVIFFHVGVLLAMKHIETTFVKESADA